MTEIIEQMGGSGFERYMNPPEPHNGQAHMSYDKNNQPWITCPHCGKRQFPIGKDTKIEKLTWKCKGSNCKKDMVVNV